LDEAREVLEQEGLVLGSTQSRTSSASEPGLIIEQNPAAGTLSAPGAAVAVIIVRGGSQ
ncbi:MAG: PASTA domain-containing protein, partial [Gemmatimonadota bacterium]